MMRNEEDMTKVATKKVTAKEMIALINADITFAAEIGDKEFVGYLKEAKEKLLDEIYPTRNEEYVELFGK